MSKKIITFIFQNPAKREKYRDHLVIQYIFDKKSGIIVEMMWNGKKYVLADAFKSTTKFGKLATFPYRRSKKDWNFVREKLGAK